MFNAEIAASMHEYYGTKVKPALQAGQLVQATRTMANLVLQMQVERQEIFPFHSGLNCITSAELMLESLRSGVIPTDSSTIEFEAFLAQLKLSTQTGNRGFTS